MALYPLRFEPIYKQKVWGGRSLEKLGRSLSQGVSIGESWELADLAVTSASGGGGGAERSVVANGPLAGRTLHELIEEHGTDLLGRLKLSDEGGFPLLVKYLDAQENLSVQVHPSPEYAAGHPDAYLKSEAWYIVHADPGAVIYKGVKQGTDAAAMRQAIENNTVEQLLIAIPVQAGDMHYLPSGTCHALGAGIVVAEVQTPSDTTFRVYDWGRTGRELHVDQALQCIEFGPADTARHEPDTLIQRDQTSVRTLVHCEHFHVEQVKVAADTTIDVPVDQPHVWMVLQGAGRWQCECGRFTEDRFAAGDTLLLPPGCDSLRVLFDQSTTYLNISFPQAMGSDLIA
jgi:mannose-6-phosphate isomerase